MLTPVSALLALLLLPLALLASYDVGPAHAAPRPLVTTGTVVDWNGLGPVEGVTVRLRAVGRGGPGTVIATDTTNAKGVFSLAGGAQGQEVYVELVDGLYQGGVSGDLVFDDGEVQRIFYQTKNEYSTYEAGSALGKIRANPTWIEGRFINPKTKRGVAGLTVKAIVYTGVVRTATTNRGGWFRMDDVHFDGGDANLRAFGAKVGYENGYVTCFDDVKPQAFSCATSIGTLKTPIRIDAK